MAPSKSKPRGNKLPTLKTIAEELHLSLSTVSRALQGDAAVTSATTARVIEAADRLGYRRDLRGVNLRTGKTFTLCAILGSNPSQEFGDPAAMHLIEGLIEGTEGSEFKIVIRPVEGAEQRLLAVREAVRDGRFDGIVLDHTEPQDRAVLFLLEHDVRFVTFGRSELFSTHPYFDIDNEHAAYVATKHLAETGHTRIAMIDPPPHFLFAAQRLRGYRKALEEAGLGFAPELVSEMPIGARRVRERVEQLLSIPQRPTGFVTSNEVSTLGTIAACRSLPQPEFERVGFVSRDGTNLFDYVRPWVSSCYYPLLDAGHHLANVLIQAVRGAPTETLQRVEQVSFVERPHRDLGHTL